MENQNQKITKYFLPVVIIFSLLAIQLGRFYYDTICCFTPYFGPIITVGIAVVFIIVCYYYLRKLSVKNILPKWYIFALALIATVLIYLVIVWLAILIGNGIAFFFFLS
jgi:hypothetical protein